MKASWEEAVTNITKTMPAIFQKEIQLAYDIEERSNGRSQNRSLYSVFRFAKVLGGPRKVFVRLTLTTVT